jgi:hypothetical protein
LSGWLFNQLDSPDFAWRTKNSLLGEVSIKKRGLGAKKKRSTKYGGILRRGIGKTRGPEHLFFGNYS